MPRIARIPTSIERGNPYSLTLEFSAGFLGADEQIAAELRQTSTSIAVHSFASNRVGDTVELSLTSEQTAELPRLPHVLLIDLVLADGSIDPLSGLPQLEINIEGAIAAGIVQASFGITVADRGHVDVSFGGARGPGATVEVGDVETGAPGTDAQVIESGTPTARVVSFVIPRGDKGEKGDKGNTGDVTPALSQARDEAIAAAGVAGTARDQSVASKAGADAAAALSVQANNDAQTTRSEIAATVAGTPNAIVATTASGSWTNTAKRQFAFIAATANTGPVTIAIDGKAVAPVLDPSGYQLDPGVLQAGSLMMLVYGADGFRQVARSITLDERNKVGIFSLRSFPGWVRTQRDKSKRLIWGVRTDGTEWAYKSERQTLTVTGRLTASEKLIIGTGAAIASSRKYSGYLRAWTDSSKRILFAFLDDGTVFAQKASFGALQLASLAVPKLSIGPTTRLAARNYPGFLYAWIDSSKRIFFSVLTDGKFFAPDIKTNRLTAGSVRRRSAACFDATWIVFTRADATGDYQVYKQSRASGQVTQLTTSGNHTDLSVSAGVAYWLLDGKHTYAVTLAGGTPYPLLPVAALTAIGHSMLADYSTDRQPALPYLIGDALNLPVVDFAIQGQNAKQQIARVGLVATTVTVTGNTIPASGPVAVTALTPNDFARQAYGARTVYGWLAGVYGSLTWDGTSGEVERFTRSTPGDAVSISPGATWVPDTGSAFDNIGLIWTLVNTALTDQASLDAALADLMTIINGFRAVGKRFIVLTELPRTNETTGTPARALRDQLNQMVRAALPDNYIDPLPLLVANASAGDAAAVAQGLTPPSLTVDGFHANNAGNKILKTGIVNFINAKGWLNANGN